MSLSHLSLLFGLRVGKTLNPCALVLVTNNLFRILCGPSDSVLRDHMLEMQGFVLAYAAMALKMQGREAASGMTATV